MFTAQNTAVYPMNKYLEVIKSIIPQFKKEDLDKPFSKAGVDSFDLVTIRVELEQLKEKPIPDKHWLTFESFKDIIDFYEGSGSNGKASTSNDTNAHFSKEFIIGMPQMSIESLSENWLFKELGDNHWNLLCNGLNRASDKLEDELGNRLYATFVRIRIRSTLALCEFNENEKINMHGSMKRYGNGMYFSTFQLQSKEDQERHIHAELMTSFAIRKSTNSNVLVKSRPDTDVNTIHNTQSIPEFGNEYRLIKKGEMNEVQVSDHEFEIEDNALFETEYSINAYYDLNGVGLLYFAAYPIINDTCEARYFNSQNNSDLWEKTHSTVSRDILYYANCDLDDTIIYHLNSMKFMEGGLVKTSSSLYRKSDGKRMARVFTVKKERL